MSLFRLPGLFAIYFITFLTDSGLSYVIVIVDKRLCAPNTNILFGLLFSKVLWNHLFVFIDRNKNKTLMLFMFCIQLVVIPSSDSSYNRKYSQYPENMSMPLFAWRILQEISHRRSCEYIGRVAYQGYNADRGSC